MPTLFYISFVLFIALLLFIVLRRPTQKRNWAPEHAVPARAEAKKGSLTLKNVISADYTAPLTCNVTHYDKTFKIKEVDSLWFLIEYFPIGLGPIHFNVAHSFLSFGLRDGSFISISVAGRRKKGEHITFARILPHKNEIIYKVIDECDTVFARCVHERDDVRLYKVNVSAHVAQRVLLSMCEDINKLAAKPKWFDTFTRNCTTEMAKHLRKAGIKAPLWHPSYILTTGVDNLLKNRGVICERRDIAEQVRELGKHPELSKKIREF